MIQKLYNENEVYQRLNTYLFAINIVTKKNIIFVIIFGHSFHGKIRHCQTYELFQGLQIMMAFSENRTAATKYMTKYIIRHAPSRTVSSRLQLMSGGSASRVCCASRSSSSENSCSWIGAGSSSISGTQPHHASSTLLLNVLDH